MATTNQLEQTLEDIFVKKAPALPANGKALITQWAPWVSLVIGLLTLWAALALWQAAHLVNNAANYVNTLNAAYGTGVAVSTVHMSMMLWLGLLVLLAEALLYLLAFAPLKARKKSGWNLLYYAALVNVAYGIVVLFTDYGGVSTFIGTVIGSAVGLYFLFQIRANYKLVGVKVQDHSQK